VSRVSTTQRRRATPGGGLGGRLAVGVLVVLGALGGLLGRSAAPAGAAVHAGAPRGWTWHSSDGLPIAVPRTWVVRAQDNCPDTAAPGTLLLGSPSSLRFCPFIPTGPVSASVVAGSVSPTGGRPHPTLTQYGQRVIPLDVSTSMVTGSVPSSGLEETGPLTPLRTWRPVGRSAGPVTSARAVIGLAEGDPQYSDVTAAAARLTSFGHAMSVLQPEVTFAATNPGGPVWAVEITGRVEPAYALVPTYDSWGIDFIDRRTGYSVGSMAGRGRPPANFGMW
jgi:hypothetical protein